MNRIGGFQSSALPTELPGQEMRKRVLNSCPRSESSPNRRFCALTPIIPGSRRSGFGGGDAKVIESDPEADSGGFGVGAAKCPQRTPKFRISVAAFRHIADLSNLSHSLDFS